MTKADATNGAFSSADIPGRWLVLAEKFARVRIAMPPIASSKIADCEIEFWSLDAEMTVSASRCGQLVAYLRVVQKDAALFAGDVGVSKTHRRQGIATAMYNLAESVLQSRFAPCVPHTKHAAAFWENRLAQTAV